MSKEQLGSAVRGTEGPPMQQRLYLVPEVRKDGCAQPSTEQMSRAGSNTA
jgi:hypothetical protein